jgi:hypothetical protein
MQILSALKGDHTVCVGICVCATLEYTHLERQLEICVPGVDKPRCTPLISKCGLGPGTYEPLRGSWQP